MTEKTSELNGHVFVQQTVYNQETTEEHLIRVPNFADTEPAKVRMTGSITKNLGNFNSARIEVSIEMPCLPTKEEIYRVAQMEEEWIDEIIQEKVSRITTDA